MLDWIKTFLAVYREGSVTAASRALHLTQPTVSQQLRSLEAHLGTTLFDRLPRGMAPTAAGEELAAALGSHVDLIEAAVDSARRGVSGSRAGTLRIGGPAELLAERVVPGMKPLLDQGISLRVRLGLPDELVGALRGRELDLVIATSRVRARGITYERLYEEELVLVAGPRCAERVTPRSIRAHGARALSGVPILAYAAHLPLLRRYWRTVFGERLTAAPRIVAPDLRILLRATAAGAGITVVPAYLAAEAIGRRELVQLVHRADPPRNVIHLAHHEGALDDARVSLGRDHLKRAAAAW